ncbi:MAG: hypothetical protein Q9191_000962 [Dirinaria sp. TL-2023a]
MLSFNTSAPAGYTFIPAGDPQLTNRCKQFAREEGSKVFIVSASKHKNVSNLSHEVHRVGYHFPSTVVDKACTSLGVTLRSGQVVHNHRKSPVRQDPKPNSKPKKKKNAIGKKNASPQSGVSQATIDTEAREAIRDLFPNIPENDLYDIIRQAFSKKRRRVGTSDQPLTRRVQLAVVAHIRHNYTNYDNLLRIGSWEDARKAVEHACLDKLVRWRAEEDDNADAMSDILREVIVISDDEDEDQEDANVSELEHRSQSHPRDDSVEIISSQAELETIRTEQVDYRDLEEPRDEELKNEGTGSYARRRQPRYDYRRLDKSDAHRRQVWQEARVRRQKSPITADVNSGRHTLQEHLSSGANLDKAGQHVDIWSSELPSGSPRQGDSQNPYGRLGNLIPLDQQAHRATIASRSPMVYASAHNDRHQSPQLFSRAEKVIPSIEGPFSNDQAQQSPFAFESSQDRDGFGFTRDAPRRPRVIQMDVEPDNSSGKRRRVAEVEPSYSSNYHPSSGERQTERTVLIPLDQYKETLDKGGSYNERPSEDLNSAPRNGPVRLYLPPEEPLPRPLQGASSRVSGEVYRLPADTFATEQVTSRPHLQVQLKPPGSGIPETSLLRPSGGSDSYQTLPLFHSGRSSLPYSPSDSCQVFERDRGPFIHEHRVARPERLPQSAMPLSPRDGKRGKNHLRVLCVPQYPRPPDVPVRRELASTYVAPTRVVPPEGHSSWGRTSFPNDHQVAREPHSNLHEPNPYWATTQNRERLQQQQYHQYSHALPGHPSFQARASPGTYDNFGTVGVVTSRDPQAAKVNLQEGSAHDPRQPSPRIVPLRASHSYDAAAPRYGEHRRDVIVID